ncbi:Inheritance of peroxisomes protein 1 [Lasallia pustulata]|uniref:Inheritance of peroxisomes protein 1 n=1 Tax=Lasallia pustulata TaxID=136370 RepID=A0A1W5DDZ2_9LECA|nr:Inheritance of peroxisomes protein 1 [Lasallia pustulata]
MASITAPTTPENAAPPVPSMRRAFTVPPKLTGDIRSRVLTEEKEEQRAETLFAHSSARIVSFTSLSTPSRLGSSSGRGRGQLEDESMGTLPWASSTEITIAAGPLRIYRVLGTTAFLNSGETLHTIFPKSQCWCVDGESKFVLRIRLNSYYRIELPFSTSEDIEKVEEFKGVLAKLLQVTKDTNPIPPMAAQAAVTVFSGGIGTGPRKYNGGDGRSFGRQ